MLNPSMQELMKRVGNRYLLVNLAAQRARDIADEAEEKGEPLPDKAVKLALDIGSACAGVQILRRSAGAREGQRRGFRAVHHGRGDGAQGYRAGTPHL